MKKFLGLSLSDVVFIMLINVKMPTRVGILTFISRINLSSAELSMEKRFITSGPGGAQHYLRIIANCPLGAQYVHRGGDGGVHRVCKL